jgi:hypothetical protein
VFAASAPFAAMVEGVEQRVEWLLTMALTDAAGDPVAEDVNLALESCRIEAQSQTDVPDQVRMQSGFPTIAVTFTLSGYVGDMSAADFFRRWNRDSPLWLSDALNAKVTVDVGLLPDGAAGTPELIRKFTGSSTPTVARLTGPSSSTVSTRRLCCGRSRRRGGSSISRRTTWAGRVSS